LLVRRGATADLSASLRAFGQFGCQPSIFQWKGVWESVSGLARGCATVGKVSLPARFVGKASKFQKLTAQTQSEHAIVAGSVDNRRPLSEACYLFFFRALLPDEQKCG